MKAGRCIKCRGNFKYEPVLTPRGKEILRHVCDDCRAARERFSKKSWKKLVRAPVRNRTKGEPRSIPADGYEATLDTVARALGLDLSTVEMAQRSALHKIRASPELREAFEQYAEAGMPRVKELLAMGGGREERRAQRLLELQLQVADCWQVYEAVLATARALDADPLPLRNLPLWRQRERTALKRVNAELTEILNEIAGFQKLLRTEFNL